MKKVCMVIAYHPFLDARIFKKEAKSLQKKGYHVSMIVPRKKGHLFDIDGTPFTKKFRNKVFMYEGIKIITYDSERTRNALNKVVQDEAVWERQGFNNPLVKLAMKEDADIYHTHEYLSLFAGVGIKRLMKKQKGKDIQLIYDSHELTPDPLHPKYSEEKRKNLLEKLFIMLKETDYVITVSDSIRNWYLERMPGLRIELLYNSPPLARNFQSKPYDSNSLTIGYEGNMEDNKGSRDKLFGITEKCAKKTDFQFKIIGGNRFGDVITIPEHLKSNIKQTGWVDYHSIPKHMKEIDIGWIDLGNVDQSLNRNYSLPNKFFSYLNNGIPVVVNKCEAMEKFIEKYQCGYVIDKKQATVEDFVKVFLDLHQNKKELRKMSKNARKLMEKTYAWEKMEERLYRVYEELS